MTAFNGKRLFGLFQRPFLWKGPSSVARRGWLPRMWKACGKYIPPRTVIPSAVEGSLWHCRHMHACALSQTTPWCFLLSPFSHSRVTGLQEGSLHFGPHDKQNTNHLTSFFIPLRRSILHLWRGPFGLTGRRLNGQARRLFGLGQTRKSLCGTSVSKGLLVSSE